MDAKWIKSKKNMGEIIPVFYKKFKCDKDIKSAVLTVTALGVYKANINGISVGDYVMAPGWTSYESRLQYQCYDITKKIKKDNKLEISVGKGWYRSRLVGWMESERQNKLRKNPAAVIAEICIEYADGTQKTIITDENWMVRKSRTLFSEIYDGEVYDASIEDFESGEVKQFDGPTETLIPQQGEKITMHECVQVKDIFKTPKGEVIVDFGQEVTGVPEIMVDAVKGQKIDFSFGEVLDSDGNFYNENYRSAKCRYQYICKDGFQKWMPEYTFYGFRYIKVNEFPNGAESIAKENLQAHVIHSDIKRIGFIETSNKELNKLVNNCIWGQKSNFLDVPTDCPQRDERLGWTGDAQVFVRTACTNYDVKKFFEKWLADLACDQHKDGYVGHVIPDLLNEQNASAAWGDAATICPWEVYLAYGDDSILKNQFESMKKWVDYITKTTTKKYMWEGGTHYGDWLGLDAPEGSYKGSSRENFIATAYYAYSTSLVVKAGKVIGKDVTEYEELYDKIIEKFNIEFPEYKTQTEYAVALYFGLTKEPGKVAQKLAEKIKKDGTKIKTGFVGTPYILHALSENGHTELAYELLLRKEYPSWLYPVTKGATTIWEHWDGINDKGTFWSADMNSYNHYAYGSVLDWIYGKAAGIKVDEEHPGYERVLIEPKPTKKLDWLSAEINTKYGKIISKWTKEEKGWRYDITTPVETEICIDSKKYIKKAGSYIFYGK